MYALGMKQYSIMSITAIQHNMPDKRYCTLSYIAITTYINCNIYHLQIYKHPIIQNLLKYCNTAGSMHYGIGSNYFSLV